MRLFGDVYLGPESSIPKQKLVGLAKFAWYLCASVLILSLPTFSYLRPRHEAAAPRPASEVSSTGNSGEVATASTPVRLLTSLVRGVVSAATGSSTHPVGRPGSAPSREDRSAEPEAADPVGSTAVERRGSEVIPPRFFERRRAAPLPAPIDEEATGSGQVQDGLDELQEGYEQAFNNLFPEVFLGARAGGNPFQGALEESGSNPGSESSGDQGGTVGGDESASGSPEPAPETPPAPDPNDSGQSGDSGGVGDVSNPPQPLPPFNFLVVGHLPGNASDALVSRARLDSNGEFALENSYRFSFFPGIFHSILTFGENEKLEMSDLDNDGSLDLLVVTEVPSVGTAIESYLQKTPGEFELGASAFLYLQAIRSFSLFDFNRDGKDELALVLASNDNLVVFEQVGSEWRYLRELALSIRPGLVMSSAVAPGVKNRQLYVIDRDLQFVLTSDDRQPDFFRPGSKAPLNRLRLVEANLTGRNPGPNITLVFILPDQVVLAEGLGGTLRTFGSFATNPSPPLVIIGDYAQKGSRQMLWVP